MFPSLPALRFSKRCANAERRRSEFPDVSPRRRPRRVSGDRGPVVRSPASTRSAAGMITMHWFDWAGLVGVLLVLLAYFLLQAGRVHGNALPYQLMNALGA